MSELGSLRGFHPDWPQTCDTCRGVGLVGGHGDQRECGDCKGTGLPTVEVPDGMPDDGGVGYGTF